MADPGERFDAFCALTEDVRAGWLAWVVARSLLAVPAGTSGSDFVDHLGSQLGIDVAAWWRPTAANYFDRLTRAAILAHLEEVGGKELASRYGASKKRELAMSAEGIFAGTVPVQAETRAIALAWVPGAMRFVTPDDVPATEGTERGQRCGPNDPADGEEKGDIAQAA